MYGLVIAISSPRRSGFYFISLGFQHFANLEYSSQESHIIATKSEKNRREKKTKFPMSQMIIATNVKVASPGPGYYLGIDMDPKTWPRGKPPPSTPRNAKPARGISCPRWVPRHPNEREMSLSDGRRIRDLQPAPKSQTEPPPRAVSPTLLRVAARRRSKNGNSASRRSTSPLRRSRSTSPRSATKQTSSAEEEKNENAAADDAATSKRGGSHNGARECLIGLYQREMMNRPDVGPGAYVMQAPKGAYARGIVFSSVPRGLHPIPPPPLPIPGYDDAAPVSVFPPLQPRLGSPFLPREQKDVAALLSSSSSSLSPHSLRRPSMSLIQQRAIVSGSSRSSGTASSRKQAATKSSFGTSKRLMDASSWNPFLPHIEQAPPVGCYQKNVVSFAAVPRGGPISPRGTVLGRAERVIALERKTAAPGPLSYDISRFDLASRVLGAY